MLLLNVKTEKLEKFPDNFDQMPKYAILSHTWLHPEEKEVSYQNLTAEQPYRHKEGYGKMAFICTRARQDGLDYAWIDSCCIDKASTVELARAINSMFRYYTNSAICYVYLSDVKFQYENRHSNRISREWRDQFSSSRWHSRGWTLQEAIAPTRLEFFEARGEFLGTRHDLARETSRASGIDLKALRENVETRLDLVKTFSVAQRLAWAARRKTTEPEDIAYSLVGFFDVYLVPRYGEGAKEAFKRLQMEIMSKSTDQSILAWAGDGDGLLAPSPSCFLGSKDIVPLSTEVLYSPFLDLSRNGLLHREYLLDLRDLRSNYNAPPEATHVVTLKCDCKSMLDFGPCLYLCAAMVSMSNTQIYYPTVGRRRMCFLHFNELSYPDSASEIFIRLERPISKRGIYLELWPLSPGVPMQILSSATTRITYIDNSGADYAKLHNGAVRDNHIHDGRYNNHMIGAWRFSAHENGPEFDVNFESDRERQVFRVTSFRNRRNSSLLSTADLSSPPRSSSKDRPWVPWLDNFAISGNQAQTKDPKCSRTLSLRCRSKCVVVLTEEFGWIWAWHEEVR